jgi:hypothetical protein
MLQRISPCELFPNSFPQLQLLTTLLHNTCYRMPTYHWEKHDELIDSCNTIARKIIAEIDEAQVRIAAQDEADETGEYHEEIANKWTMLEVWHYRAKRAIVLCDWERLGRKANRTHSPYDTEPSTTSRYAYALNIEGKVNVSPMRVLWQLERRLETALIDVVEF